MWSSIIKPNEEVFVKDKVIDEIKVIPIVTGDQLVFKREIKAFVEEHKDILDKIYKKYFKDYNHISKKDFYIFAYNTTKK